MDKIYVNIEQIKSKKKIKILIIIITRYRLIIQYLRTVVNGRIPDKPIRSILTV